MVEAILVVLLMELIKGCVKEEKIAPFAYNIFKIIRYLNYSRK
jgi:hypothetical protein